MAAASHTSPTNNELLICINEIKGLLDNLVLVAPPIEVLATPSDVIKKMADLIKERKFWLDKAGYGCKSKEYLKCNGKIYKLRKQHPKNVDADSSIAEEKPITEDWVSWVSHWLNIIAVFRE